MAPAADDTHLLLFISADCPIKDSFVLPVDLEAYGARRAHYLCREMKMTATLPDGSTRGRVSLAEGYANRRRARLRQFRREPAQSERATQTRRLGPRIFG
jgi:hypothetical protein